MDSLLSLEEEFTGNGVRDGIRDGVKMGNHEGFVFGLSYGAGIGCELGYYEGFCNAWLQVLESNPSDVKGKERAIKSLKQLLDLVKKCNLDNSSEEHGSEKESTRGSHDSTNVIEKARAKSRQIMALLRGNTHESEETRPSMSF